MCVWHDEDATGTVRCWCGGHLPAQVHPFEGGGGDGVDMCKCGAISSVRQLSALTWIT